MKKIEIIARISCEGKTTEEKTLLSWKDADQAIEDISVCPILHYPGLEIRLQQHRVLKNGKDVRLSKYEYGILSFMAQHPGTLFSKEQIFENIWAEDSNSCFSAVTNTISRIRQKIEDDKEQPVYIQTISNLQEYAKENQKLREKVEKLEKQVRRKEVSFLKKL